MILLQALNGIPLPVVAPVDEEICHTITHILLAYFNTIDPELELECVVPELDFENKMLGMSQGFVGTALAYRRILDRVCVK